MACRRLILQTSVTYSAATLTAASGTVHGADKYLGPQGIKQMTMVLRVSSHDNTDANETYQFYITTGFKMPSGTVVRWDVGAFTVVSGADAEVQHVMVASNGAYVPTSVVANGTLTGISPNLSCVATNLRGTITTGVVRNGYFGEFLSWTLVGGGTTPGPITFGIGGLVWD
jgi:hypothetical protein